MSPPQRQQEPRIDELTALPAELAPPPELERRVIGALRERGLLVSDTVAGTTPAGTSSARPAAARPGPGPARWAALAAACLVAFTAGWFGRSLALEPAAPAPVDARPRFLLLLGEAGAGGKLPPEELTARIEEHRAWARGLASRGLLEVADRLEPRAVRLDRIGGDGGGSADPVAPAADDPGTVRGFFLIRAGDLEEALGIAGTCPHLRHGGSVTVRPISG